PHSLPAICKERLRLSNSPRWESKLTFRRLFQIQRRRTFNVQRRRHSNGKIDKQLTSTSSTRLVVRRSISRCSRNSNHSKSFCSRRKLCLLSMRPPVSKPSASRRILTTRSKLQRAL